MDDFRTFQKSKFYINFFRTFHLAEDPYVFTSRMDCNAKLKMSGGSAKNDNIYKF